MVIPHDRSDSIFSSPKTCTPIKSLPFSPSQFLNSPGAKRRTSTPTEQKPPPSTVTNTLNTPTVIDTNNNNEGNYRTPRIRRTLLQMSPRTPTPFKNALKILNETKMAHVSFMQNYGDRPTQSMINNLRLTSFNIIHPKKHVFINCSLCGVSKY